MSKILPEQILEKSIELAERYKPTLEEMFDVDLSDVTIKHVDEMAEDLYQLMLNVDPDNPRTPLEESMAKTILTIGRQDLKFYEEVVEMCIETGDGSYIHELDTVYVGSLRPLFEDGLAKTVVHELGHAVVNRLVPRDALPVDSWLWHYVDEGFAEHLSIDAFLHDYDLLAVTVAMAARKLWHDCTVKTQLSPGNIFQRVGAAYTKPTPDIGRFSAHSFGYVFFSYADAVGIPPVDILMNPPQEFSEILNPDEYVLRMRIVGKLL